MEFIAERNVAFDGVDDEGIMELIEIIKRLKGVEDIRIAFKFMIDHYGDYVLNNTAFMILLIDSIDEDKFKILVTSWSFKYLKMLESWLLMDLDWYLANFNENDLMNGDFDEDYAYKKSKKFLEILKNITGPKRSKLFGARASARKKKRRSRTRRAH